MMPLSKELTILIISAIPFIMLLIYSVYKRIGNKGNNIKDGFYAQGNSTSAINGKKIPPNGNESTLIKSPLAQRPLVGAAFSTVKESSF